MKNNTLKGLSAAIIAIALINLIVSAIFVVLVLPAQVPVHFDASFVCDRIGSRWTGLIAPVILAIVFPLCLLGESKSDNAEKNKKPLTIIVSFISVMVVGVNWFILLIMNSGAELGDKIPANFDVLLPFIIGLMFVVMGNYLPTVRQNKTLGIKLPWTLKNERCWDKTHRFSGRIMVIMGIIMIAAALTLFILKVGSFVPYITLTLLSPAITVIIPTIYAYLHRND